MGGEIDKVPGDVVGNHFELQYCTIHVGCPLVSHVWTRKKLSKGEGEDKIIGTDLLYSCDQQSVFSTKRALHWKFVVVRATFSRGEIILVDHMAIA
jgi:hypothetical protein